MNRYELDLKHVDDEKRMRVSVHASDLTGAYAQAFGFADKLTADHGWQVERAVTADEDVVRRDSVVMVWVEGDGVWVGTDAVC